MQQRQGVAAGGVGGETRGEAVLEPQRRIAGGDGQQHDRFQLGRVGRDEIQSVAALQQRQQRRPGLEGAVGVVAQHGQHESEAGVRQTQQQRREPRRHAGIGFGEQPLGLIHRDRQLRHR